MRAWWIQLERMRIIMIICNNVYLVLYYQCIYIATPLSPSFMFIHDGLKSFYCHFKEGCLVQSTLTQIQRRSFLSKIVNSSVFFFCFFFFPSFFFGVFPNTEDYLPLIAGFVALVVMIISVFFVSIYTIYYKNTKMGHYTVEGAKPKAQNGDVAQNGKNSTIPMKKIPV